MRLQNKTFIGGLLLLVALSAVIHWQWLVRSGVFTEGDWWYAPNQSFKEFLSSPKILDGAEDFNIGAQTPMFAPIKMIGGLLTYIGDAFPIWERLLFLWPIALLGTIPMYILLYRRHASVTAAIAGTIVYAFNSYILIRASSHLYIAIGYLIFAPLLFLALDRLLKHPSAKNGLLFTITTIGFSIYEIRILYITTLLLITYVIYQLVRRKVTISRHTIAIGLFSIGAIILAQSYWLAPFIFSNSSLGYAAFATRSLFQSFATVYHALALSDPFWTGETFVVFTTQPLARLAYGIPFLAFFWIVAKPRKEKAGDLWFWTFVACIGIFLAKQANPPFPNAYQWIFEHVPGFNLFRDASKFYLYIAFAYAIMVSSTVSFLQKRRVSYVLAPILFLAAWVIVNTTPFVRDVFTDLTAIHTAPKQYISFQKLLEEDKEFNRSLWAPTVDKFVFYSQTHPRVNGGGILEGDWKTFVQNQSDPYLFLSQPNAKSLLNFGSISYIAAPLDATNGIYKWYSRTKNDFSSLIAQIPGLIPVVLDEPGLPLWKNNEAKPHLYIADEVALADTHPVNYSGDDKNKTSAVIFKSDVSSSFYSEAQTSLATSWEAQPFALENIAVIDNQLQTASKIPPLLNLTTTDTYATQDRIEELYAQKHEGTIALFTKRNGQNNALGEFEAPDTPLIVDINGKRFSDVRPSTEEKILGTVRIREKANQINVYKEISNDTPLLQNPSFEEGAWSTGGDCANTDGSSAATNQISTSISTSATHGTKALVLSAGRHLGCTQSALSSANGATFYTASFDYKHINGDNAMIKILGNSPAMPPLASVELGNSPEWEHKQLVFSDPNADAGPFMMYLYQIGSIKNNQAAQSMFDNFDIHGYNIIFEKKFDSTDTQVDSAPRPFIGSDIEIHPTYPYTPDNIVLDGSFKNVSQYQAGDCANSDGTSAEANGIKSRISEENGIRSLVLEASGHLACVALPLQTPDPAFDYIFSLQYKILQGGGPAIAFHPQQNGPASRRELPLQSDSSWHTFRTTIHGGDITKDTKIFLYTSVTAFPSEVAFADLQMIKIPILPQRSVSSKNAPLPSIHTTTHTIDSTLHSIDSEPILTPRLLLLSDRYDTGWRLFVRPQGTPSPSWWQRAMGKHQGTEISAQTHIKANAFVNGWVLDPAEIQRAIGQGTMPEFIVEYWPQRFMDMGTLVSIVALSIYLLCTLAAILIEKRLRKTVTSSSP